MMFDDVRGWKCYLIVPWGNSVKLPPTELKYFRGFFHWKVADFFYHRLLDIPKDDKIVYNNFFEKLKILLHLGFP